MRNFNYAQFLCDPPFCAIRDFTPIFCSPLVHFLKRFQRVTSTFPSISHTSLFATRSGMHACMEIISGKAASSGECCCRLLINILECDGAAAAAAALSSLLLLRVSRVPLLLLVVPSLPPLQGVARNAAAAATTACCRRWRFILGLPKEEEILLPLPAEERKTLGLRRRLQAKDPSAHIQNGRARSTARSYGTRGLD